MRFIYRWIINNKQRTLTTNNKSKNSNQMNPAEAARHLKPNSFLLVYVIHAPCKCQPMFLLNIWTQKTPNSISRPLAKLGKLQIRELICFLKALNHLEWLDQTDHVAFIVFKNCSCFKRTQLASAYGRCVQVGNKQNLNESETEQRSAINTNHY